MGEIALGTWNFGNGNRHDLEHVMAMCHAFGGQEGGDRADFAKYARNNDWKTILGDARGSASTPLYFNPEHMPKLRKKICAPMIGGRPNKAGAGAGPSVLKPKWAVGGRFGDDHERPLIMASTHLVASSYMPTRKRLAQQHIHDLLKRFDTEGPAVRTIVGDFNTKPDSKLLTPMYKAGWTNTHRAGKTKPTNGRRAIDYVWWKKEPWINFLGAETFGTRSDHRALVAYFDIDWTRKG